MFLDTLTNLLDCYKFNDLAIDLLIKQLRFIDKQI